MKKSIFALISIGIIASCNVQQGSKSTDSSYSTDSIVSASEVADIRVIYPKFVNHYADSVITTGMSGLIENFKQYVAGPEDEFTWKSELITEFNVEKHGNDIVSVIINEHSYTGGAHGNTQVYSVVMDLSKNKTYKLSDFFTGSPLMSVQALIREKLRDNIDFHDFIDDGTAEEKDFEIFSINNEEITFYFPPYQVAAYAFGTQEVSIPLGNLPNFKIP